MMKIPQFDLTRQYERIEPEMEAAVRHVLRSGQFILGPEGEAFEAECAAYLSVPHAIGVGSGSDAIKLALQAFGVGPGTEVITPAGHWSSFPPHKHDVDDPPRETALEETYYHRLRPAGGFAFQRVYSPERALDESFAVGDGDVVLVPAGYHPVAAGARHDLYYLNVMAGPRREWRVTVDPDFA